MAMKIGLATGGAVAPDVLVQRAQLAESQGVDYFFAHNRMAPFERDPFFRLTLLALNTRTLILGAPSINPFLFHPVQACRAIAPIDELAPGRVILGWSAGSSVALDSIGLGERARRPLRFVREAIELSKLILSGHIPAEAGIASDVRQKPIPDEYKIHYTGEHFQLVDNLVLPSRKVPVMLTSFSPKMLQLGGEIADEVQTGWFANPGGSEWMLEQIALGAARSGRSLDDITIHRGIHLCVWPNRQVALESINQIPGNVLLSGAYRRLFGIKMPFEKEAGDVEDPNSDAFRYVRDKGLGAYLGSGVLARDVPAELHLQRLVAGTPDDCIEQLQRKVLHPRFDSLVVGLFVPPPEIDNWPKGLELLMKEVVPALETSAEARTSQ